VRQTDHAVGTVNRELRVLRRVLRFAVEWRELEHAPKVRMAGAEVKRERVVSDEEFKKYLSSTSQLQGDVDQILFETGLRPEESHRLQWDDINLNAGRLLVRHGKTDAARRQLPLTVNVRGGPALALAGLWTTGDWLRFSGCNQMRTHSTFHAEEAAPPGAEGIWRPPIRDLQLAAHVRDADRSASRYVDTLQDHGLGIIECRDDVHSRPGRSRAEGVFTGRWSRIWSCSRIRHQRQFDRVPASY
jgi:hypothetical protein